MKLSRRRGLKLMTALPGAAVALIAGRGALANTLPKTAKAAEGPYYPLETMRPADTDNDLVKIEPSVTEAGGEIVHLTGVVRNTKGEALSGVRVEIWQCDVNGRYIHTGDRNTADADPAFQGFGHTVTDDAGRYAFRTIKPVSYPGRTPHIHVKVQSRDSELTTQFYLKGHPQNERDGLFNRLSDAERAAVEMDFVARQDRLEASVDIVC